LRIGSYKGALLSALIITSVLVSLLLISAKAAWGENIQWTRQFGASGRDEGLAIAVDSSGNAYVSGWTDGTFPGQTSVGGSDAFVAKYDGTGNQLWLKQFGASGDDGGYGIAVDSSGNAYVTGIAWGTLPGQTSRGWRDVFVAKYDGAGNQLWLKQLGISESDEASDVAVDASGNLYIAGRTGALGESDVFLVKFGEAAAGPSEEAPQAPTRWPLITGVVVIVVIGIGLAIYLRRR